MSPHKREEVIMLNEDATLYKGQDNKINLPTTGGKGNEKGKAPALGSPWVSSDSEGI